MFHCPLWFRIWPHSTSLTDVAVEVRSVLGWICCYTHQFVYWEYTFTIAIGRWKPAPVSYIYMFWSGNHAYLSVQQITSAGCCNTTAMAAMQSFGQLCRSKLCPLIVLVFATDRLRLLFKVSDNIIEMILTETDLSVKWILRKQKPKTQVSFKEKFCSIS